MSAPLPKCRHRGVEVASGRWECGSDQLVIPARVVAGSFCLQCPYADQPGQPRPVPCADEIPHPALRPEQFAALCRQAGTNHFPAGWQYWEVAQLAHRQMFAEAAASPAPYPGGFAGRGIVIGAGGPIYFPCAYVCVSVLRELGCTLPVEFWHLGPEEIDEEMARLVAPLGVTSRDARQVVPQPRRLAGWELKPFSVIHSAFREVLYLDADNVPVRDPTFLFDEEPYRECGALFWPDIRGGSDVHTLAWDAAGIAGREGSAFESGQYLIDKSRCWAELRLTMYLNEHSDYWYRYVYGDKDTFKLAWHKLGRRYAMPATQAGWDWPAILQYDLDGLLLFTHACQGKEQLRRGVRLGALPQADAAVRAAFRLNDLRQGLTVERITPQEFTRRYGELDTGRALHWYTPAQDTHAVLTLLAHMRPRRVLEIGTALGHMTANLTEWSPDDALVYTIGIVQGMEQHSILEQRSEIPRREELGKFTNHFGKARKVVAVLGDSLRCDFTQFAPLDFAFIDGAHDRAHVLGDTRNVYAALRPGGCMVWHDFVGTPSWVEVRQALAEAALAEPIIHLEGSGVAFLFKQSDKAAPCANVRAESPHSSAVVHIALVSRPVEPGNDLSDAAELERAEASVYSQNGEDGVLAALFARIPPVSRFFVEFGVGTDGQQRNTRLLEQQGWHGLLMDRDAPPDHPRICRATVTAETINELFLRYAVPEEFDLLSIDIDGNDYWVWRALHERYRPRVVVVEYNASVSPDRSLAIAYEPDFCWQGTDYFGASLLALARLAERKGYRLLYCERRGVNAFFVRGDLCPDAARPVAAVYRPPDYGEGGRGHPRDPRRIMLEVEEGCPGQGT